MTLTAAIVYTAIAIGLIGLSAFLVWVIFRWLPRKWDEAERAIDEAVAMVCKPCSWTDPTAPCTCPDKGCTAMGCPKRGVRRG